MINNNKMKYLNDEKFINMLKKSSSEKDLIKELEFIIYPKRLTNEKGLQFDEFLSVKHSLQQIKLLKPSYFEHYENKNILDVNCSTFTNKGIETTRIEILDIEKINDAINMFVSNKNEISYNNEFIFNTLLSKYKNNSIIKKSNKKNSMFCNDLWTKIKLSKEIPFKDEYEIKKTKNGVIYTEKKDKSTPLNDKNKVSKEYKNHKINFRYKIRESFYVLHSTEHYLRIDLTETKTFNNINEISTSISEYEIELEYVNYTQKMNEQIIKMIEDKIILILKIIQKNNNILTKSESDNIISKYKNYVIYNKKQKIINDDNYKTLKVRKPIGLSIKDLPNILYNYVVIDKADGERYNLFIYETKIYLISYNLKVKDTGITVNSKYNFTLIDGELVYIQKYKRYLFLAFDCMMFCGKDLRSTIKEYSDRMNYVNEFLSDTIGIKNYTFPFLNTFTEIDKIDNLIYEYQTYLLDTVMTSKTDFVISRKFAVRTFQILKNEIFQVSKTIWNLFNNWNNKLYNLDGLIYQPISQLYSITYFQGGQPEYKWKPPEFNSIDFYIEFKKDLNNNILKIFDNTESISSLDENVKSNDIVSPSIPIKQTNYNDNDNKIYVICYLFVTKKNIRTDRNEPEPFIFRDNLYETRIYLKNNKILDIEGNELFDKTIVEFSYLLDSDDKFQKWIPLRTRYDKTNKLKLYGDEYGNYIDIAYATFESIISPITFSDIENMSISDKNYEDCIMTLRSKMGNISDVKYKKTPYFEKEKSFMIKDMTEFHNWIKSSLIYTLCDMHYHINKDNKKITDEIGKKLKVLDLGCGRGADIMKFYYCNLDLYVGIDKDNEALTNNKDGAIIRYNKYKSKYPNFPKFIFINADICEPLTFEKQIIFGANINNFHNYLSNNNKYDRITCQFALHYFLENNIKWNNTKDNINRLLADDGLFIFICSDADKILDLFNLPVLETDHYKIDPKRTSFTAYYTDTNGQKLRLFEIVKKFSYLPKNFDSDHIIGPGFGIGVYLSWIFSEDRLETEYLVSKNFIVNDLKKDCGLYLVDTDTFENITKLNKSFLNDYSPFEQKKETRNFFNKVSSYLSSKKEINDVLKLHTNTFRYYVFRKLNPNINKL